MATRRTKKAEAALVLSLACGATVESAARKAGVSERTAFRLLGDPVFRQQVDQARTDMAQRTTSMLTAAGMEATKTLLSLLDGSMPPSVRRASARTILEMGERYRTDNQQESRLAALEKLVRQDTPPEQEL